VRVHVSHGAGPDPDWFVVRPLPGETETSVAGTPITHEMAVESLREAGRAVFELDITGIPQETTMTTASESRLRTQATLAAEIREAWLIARAAVPLPPGIEGTRDLADPEVAEDPRVTSALDARHTAFEWALSEVVGGDYGTAPEWMISELVRGRIPGPRPEQADGGSHG